MAVLERELAALRIDRDRLRTARDASAARSWEDAQVVAIIAERDALRAALLAVVQHCIPRASPGVLRRYDPVWQVAGSVLWPDPLGTAP